MDESPSPTVLVVEDEAPLVEIYSRWLDGEYEILTAQEGERALELADESVGVVLLDRLMPGMTGEEVLTELRERVPDCKVAMVTAVEPDFEILEMGFDDYLTKPVSREELRATVRQLLARKSFASLEQELYALTAKRAALESAKDPEELDSEEYRDLQERIEEIRERLDEAMPTIDDGEFVSMVRDLEEQADREGGGPAQGDGGGADPDDREAGPDGDEGRGAGGGPGG